MKDHRPHPSGNPSFRMNRRTFVRTLGAVIAALEVGADTLGVGPVNGQSTLDGARPSPFPPGKSPSARESSFLLQDRAIVGIQMSPHTMLDEGIEACLDLIQDTAAINVVMPYTHAFHTSTLGKRLEDLATDHGKPPRDFRGRVPAVWVRHREESFRNTSLRVRPTDPTLEFSQRDLFREMVQPCREREMKVYSRILEATGRFIEGFDQVRTVDVYGNRGSYGCWSHPDYKNFWRAVVADMFARYELDGFQWGAERMGPLMNVILPWNENPPTCFCTHCIARGEAANIEAGRAREGYARLFGYVRGLAEGGPPPPEGVFTVFLRHLIRYPEILSWEYQYRLSREAVQEGMYDAAKAIQPSADIGWHVDHQPSSWDLVYRAEMSYEEMGGYSDFIKLILYHAVLGGRIRSWYLDRFQSTVLRELTLQQSLDLYYAFFGYDPNQEPSVEELRQEGFSPDYVFRETARSVASANGKARIYAGIGLDVPGSPPDDPEKIYQAVVNAFQAGARGIVVSREYEEMKVPNLQAVGRAVRSLGADS